MALTRTVLTAALKANDLIMTVTSTATGFPVVGTINASQPCLIDNELVFITGVPNLTQAVIRSRGSDGTQAIAHDINAPVVTSSVVSDFPAIPTGMFTLHPPSYPDQLTYGQSGAIVLPVKDTKIFLASPSAQTMTFSPLAPSFGSNGIELFISSQTAAAHVLSAPGLFDTGAAGSPFSTATFPSQPGASVILMFQNGLFNVVAVNGAVVFT